MKAIGFKTSQEIDHKESLVEFNIQKPKAKGFDIVIKVSAVSMNPVDTKVRANAAKDIILDEPKILGYDAVGIVDEIGENITNFKIGDRGFQ